MFFKGFEFLIGFHEKTPCLINLVFFVLDHSFLPIDGTFLGSSGYQKTVSVDVIDEETIVMKTDGPDSSYLTAVHAGPFSWMTSPEAAEEFGDRWRDEAGAGDLVYVSDTRWWLGGLQSCHAIVGSVRKETSDAAIYLREDTFEVVVTGGREDKPVTVERLY